MRHIVGYRFDHLAKRRDVREGHALRGLSPIEVPKVPVISVESIVLRTVALVPIAGFMLFFGIAWVNGVILASSIGNAKDFWGLMWAGPLAWIVFFVCLYLPFAWMRARRDAIKINSETIAELRA